MTPSAMTCPFAASVSIHKSRSSAAPAYENEESSPPQALLYLPSTNSEPSPYRQRYPASLLLKRSVAAFPKCATRARTTVDFPLPFVPLMATMVLISSQQPSPSAWLDRALDG